MNLLYTDVEEELRAGVRQVLADQSGSEAKLWRSLGVEMGLAGLAVPESLGGAGASWREAAVVQEELGRAAASAPYLGSAVMATAALLACGDEQLLPALAAGERTAALAVPFSTAPGQTSPAGGPLGTVTSVADALTADVLLVLSGGALCAVEAADVVRTRVVSLDETRPLCDVRLDGVSGRTLAAGAAAERAVEAAMLAGAALLAAEQLGVAQWCLDSTVEYVKQRHQFGRPVGSFQAVKHRLADLWVEVSQARAVARYAAGCLAEGDADLPVAAALAKAHCSEVAVRAAQECVQLHGGIGFTWEHPAHRYLKRAKSTALALGTADRHRAALAALVDLPPGMTPRAARAEPAVDGRAARAERTRRAIVDALLELTADGMYKPTAERIVERAGVSLRALWSNFRDLETLYAAAGDRIVELQDEVRQQISPTTPLPERVREFGRQRALMLEIVAPAARASSLRLPFSAHLRRYRAEQHAKSRDEIVALFGAELGPTGPRRDRLVKGILVASSWSAWTVLRDDLHLDVPTATDVLARSVLALVAAAMLGEPTG